jgi:hypothetical protein
MKMPLDEYSIIINRFKELEKRVKDVANVLHLATETQRADGIRLALIEQRIDRIKERLALIDLDWFYG